MLALRRVLVPGFAVAIIVALVVACIRRLRRASDPSKEQLRQGGYETLAADTPQTTMGAKGSHETRSLVGLPQEILLNVLAMLDHKGLTRVEATTKITRALDVDKLWYTLTERALSRKSGRFSVARWQARFPDASWKLRFMHIDSENKRRNITEAELSEGSDQSLRWLFNFKPAAGGASTATIQEGRFVSEEREDAQGSLHMQGYPPLPYKLVDHLCSICAQPATQKCSRCRRVWYCSRQCQRAAWKEHKDECAVLAQLGETGSSQAAAAAAEPQCLKIANFPNHFVKRLQNWEWIIENDNVVLMSFPSDAEIPERHSPEYDERYEELFRDHPMLRLLVVPTTGAQLFL